MEAREGDIISPLGQAGDRRTVEHGFWRKARRTLGLIPFSEDAVAAFYCATDPATPLRVKAALFGALAYFVLPFDVIPDFVAGLGYTDDAAVLIAALKLVGSAIKDSHREAARRWLAAERHQSDAGEDATVVN